jgi:hypothetical protein
MLTQEHIAAIEEAAQTLESANIIQYAIANKSCCGDPENCPVDYRYCPHGGILPETGKADAANVGELEAENERLKKLIDAMSQEGSK